MGEVLRDDGLLSFVGLQDKDRDRLQPVPALSFKLNPNSYPLTLTPTFQPLPLPLQSHRASMFYRTMCQADHKALKG